MKSIFPKEKIYKFVYKLRSDYRFEPERTMLLTARDPVVAVKMFNRKCGNVLVEVVEFTEVQPKGE